MKRLILALGIALCAVHSSDAEDPDFGRATLDELMVHCQQYGNTQERKRLRDAARVEMLARGTNAFHYLMARFHVENMANRMMADEMVRQHLEDDVAAEALLCYIDHPDDLTRKSAVYYLAFCDTPEHAPKLVPLLNDEKAAGAAMRTLGKWSYTNALPGIIPHLDDDDEQRRIIAVNALGDLREASTVGALVGMLDDPMFTVRKAANEALSGFDASADAVLMGALPGLTPVAQREVVDLLVKRRVTISTNVLAGMIRPGLSDALQQDLAAALQELQRRDD